MRKAITAVLTMCVTSAFFVSCDNVETKYLLKEYSQVRDDVNNRNEYKYDDNGNLVECIERFQGSEFNSSNKTTYKYDEGNRMTMKTVYFSGEPSSREEYRYSDTGDTLCYLTLWYDESEWKVTRKDMYVYNDGVKTHRYECYTYMSECEEDYHNLLTDNEYDAEGRLISQTVYNDGTDGSEPVMLKLDKSISEDFSREFKQYVADVQQAKSGKIKYTYNDQGKCLGFDGEDGYGNKTYCKNTYDSNGNIVKSAEKSGWSDTESITTYKYNADGKCVHRHQVLDTFVYDTYYAYDENGDTIEIKDFEEYDGNRRLNGKLYNVYSAPGMKSKTYRFGTTDDWGHDDQTITVIEYDEHGNMKKQVRHSIVGMYVEDFAYEEDYSGSPEQEVKYYISKFNMTSTFTETYEYIEMQVDNSIIGKVKSFVAGLIKKVKPESKGIEYDI